jgi:hypothetical protein
MKQIYVIRKKGAAARTIVTVATEKELAKLLDKLKDPEGSVFNDAVAIISPASRDEISFLDALLKREKNSVPGGRIGFTKNSLGDIIADIVEDSIREHMHFIKISSTATSSSKPTKEQLVHSLRFYCRYCREDVSNKTDISCFPSKGGFLIQGYDGPQKIEVRCPYCRKWIEPTC